MIHFRSAAPCLVLTASLLVTACSAPAPTPAPTKPAQATVTPTLPSQTAAPTKPVASTGTAGSTAATPPTTASASAASPAATKPGAASSSKEVEYLRSLRVPATAVLDALKKNDVAAARKAVREYDAVWNGVEVYVNVRSRELYNRIEVQDQKKIEEGLETAQPKPSELVPAAEDMVAGIDAAIKLSESGPALSPLFDDVAALRVVRAELRKIGPALKSGDTATAKAAYESFDKKWDDVEDLVKARSTSAYREIEDAMKRAAPAMKAEKPNPAEAGPLVDALIERYNYGLSLVNAAARGADPARAAHTADDVKAAVTLGQIEGELRASLPLWEAGKHDLAGQHARRAGNELFDAASGPLKAKAADASLKKALDAYLGLADKPGDAAKVRTANKAAVEAVAVAQQSLVGQFWAEPKLHGASLTGLLAALKSEAGKPDAAGAWGLLQVADAEYRLIEPKLKTGAPDQADAAAKALGALKNALPDATAPAPAAGLLSGPVDAATAALTKGLGLG